MPIVPIKFNVAIAPSNDPRFQPFFDALAPRLEVTVPSGFLQGMIVGTLPTENVGLVLLTTDNNFYVWDDGTDQYVLQASDVTVGKIEYFGMDQVDPTRYTPADGGARPRVAPFDLLFAVYGTKFGNGDGSSTFNVPDIRGRVIVGEGTGVIPAVGGNPPGTLSPRALGDILGEENHALIGTELPAIDATGTSKPAGSGSAVGYSATAGQGHNNMQPSLVLPAFIRYQ